MATVVAAGDGVDLDDRLLQPSVTIIITMKKKEDEEIGNCRNTNGNNNK